MNAKGMSSWAGPLSIVWMLGGYVLLPVGAGHHNLYFEPIWLSMLVMLSLWLGVALLLALAGLRGGKPAGKVCAILVVVMSSYFVCNRPGLDELSHTRPTQEERKLGEGNWQQLEKAYTTKNLESARSLVGKPILFDADFDHGLAGVTARSSRIFSDGEQERMSKLPQNEQSEMIVNRLEVLPKIPCRWAFTRLQKRTVRSCCSMGLEVYGILRSVSSAGIDVEPRDFGIMLCL